MIAGPSSTYSFSPAQYFKIRPVADVLFASARRIQEDAPPFKLFVPDFQHDINPFRMWAAALANQIAYINCLLSHLAAQLAHICNAVRTGAVQAVV